MKDRDILIVWSYLACEGMQKRRVLPWTYVENRVESCEKIASSSLTLFVNQMHFPYYTRDVDY